MNTHTHTILKHRVRIENKKKHRIKSKEIRKINQLNDLYCIL